MRINVSNIKLKKNPGGGCTLTMDEVAAALLNRQHGILEQMSKTQERDWKWILQRNQQQLILDAAHVKAMIRFHPRFPLDVQLVTLLKQKFPRA